MFPYIDGAEGMRKIMINSLDYKAGLQENMKYMTSELTSNKGIKFDTTSEALNQLIKYY